MQMPSNALTILTWTDHSLRRFSCCQIFCITGDFRNLVDVNYVAAMGPPGGGRNPVTARLMRHFNLISFTELEEDSQAKIFGTILKSWTGNTLPCVSWWNVSKLLLSIVWTNLPNTFNVLIEQICFQRYNVITGTSCSQTVTLPGFYRSSTPCVRTCWAAD